MVGNTLISWPISHRETAAVLARRINRFEHMLCVNQLQNTHPNEFMLLCVLCGACRVTAGYRPLMCVE
jgi:hypothetical protein